MAITSAIVHMEITDNTTWEDAFMFGTTGDTTWSFTDQSFRMDLKRSRNDTDAVLTLSTDAGTIVVDDEVQRILHFNVPEATVQASFPEIPGDYRYDLIMYDGSSPSVRVALMSGKVKVVKGITGG